MKKPVPPGVIALSRLQQQSWDVLLTDRDTTVGDSLEAAQSVSLLHPWVRVITLWPAATNQQIIAAMRANVFACFTEPFDAIAIADMIEAALRASEWRDGIEVVSGLPHWLTLRVACHLLTADRLTRFMSEMQQSALADAERDLLIAAFRELLLNAMEHGAGFFDPNKVIEVTTAKTGAPSCTTSRILVPVSMPTISSMRRCHTIRTISRRRCWHVRPKDSVLEASGC